MKPGDLFDDIMKSAKRMGLGKTPWGISVELLTDSFRTLAENCEGIQPGTDVERVARQKEYFRILDFEATYFVLNRRHVVDRRKDYQAFLTLVYGEPAHYAFHEGRERAITALSRLGALDARKYRTVH